MDRHQLMNSKKMGGTWENEEVSLEIVHTFKNCCKT